MHPESNADFCYFCRAWRKPLGMITYYIVFRNALMLIYSRPLVFWEVVIFFPWLSLIFFRPVLWPISDLLNQKSRDLFFVRSLSFWDKSVLKKHPEGNANFFFCRAWRQPLDKIMYYSVFRNSIRLTHLRSLIFWEIVTLIFLARF